MTFKDMDKILRKDGWTLHRVVGSHHHYKHQTKSGKVTVVRHGNGKDIAKGTEDSILKQAGLKKRS